MAHPGYTSDEIAARGREIYEKHLRRELEPQNIGKFLVIDIETGEYEMDDDEVLASERVSSKRPDGARYGMRIGYLTSGAIGNAVTLASRQSRDGSTRRPRLLCR